MDTATAVKEKPILMSGPMVRAILGGKKTQARRVMKRNVPVKSGVLYDWFPGGRDAGFQATSDEPRFDVPSGWATSWCPCGMVGERLWVRESWMTHEDPKTLIDGILFRADGGFTEIENTRDAANRWGEAAHFKKPAKPEDGVRVHPGVTLSMARRKTGWQPSIHMPRWASRIILEITDVRVERVNSISYRDCVAEGIPSVPVYDDAPEPETLLDAIRDEYWKLWDSINGKRLGCSWASNPWVWVIEFRRLEPKP